MKKKILKAIAVFTAMNILAETFIPTAVLALTGGPSQPEVESFEPVGTTEMVDLFSGDFNYNIPLMTVPGPNGGYPINLAYHAGIGMEQEASWVGLGWNINPGVINRQMRGLPDDFNGDLVKKEINMKPNRTIGLGASPSLVPLEIWGLDINLNATAQIYYNNYRGLGVNAGISLSDVNLQAISPGLSGSISLSFDSQSGIGVKPSLSYSKTVMGKEKKTKEGTNVSKGLTVNSKVGMELNSRSGLSMNAGVEVNKETKEREGLNSTTKSGRPGGISFSASAFVPKVTTAMTGMSQRVEGKLGFDALGSFTNVPIFGSYSQQEVLYPSRDVPAYGYLYTQNRNPDVNLGLVDLNRERELAPSKNIPSLGVPSYTNDIYMVKGQGIGGVFRPYRSDISYLYDPRTENQFNAGQLGVEVGGGPPNIHLGLNISESFSESSSGIWEDLTGTSGALAPITTTPDGTPAALYEPVYFKMVGEQNSNTIDESVRYNGEDLVKFPIGNGFSGESFKPIVKNLLAISYNRRIQREKRTQSIEYRTNQQLGSVTTQKYFNDIEDFPTTQTSPPAFVYDDDNKPSQIGLISVLNPDGNRYEYGIPAYNHIQKEVMFNLGTATPVNPGDKTIGYSTTDASTDNEKGDDNFFSRTTTPPYSHSYLLTAIYSPDYIDLTGNGPSDDDFGYFVKFNYALLSDEYEWRVPYDYAKANYSAGYDSDGNDQKGSYTYGKKDIYYLNSIETKTHVAEFHLGERSDGIGAAGEGPTGVGSGVVQKRLDHIVLFSKSDPNYAPGGSDPTPIKEVYFEYNYDLCKEVENNSTAHEGKLTLKKVWFKHLNNKKGKLNPYQFDYNEGYAEQNPNYGLEQMDRWGNYRPETGIYKNVDNPFVNQKSDYDNDLTVTSGDTLMRNTDAAVWNLKKITLPSGGEINIDYESDDYAYVQDRPAMQMLRITGTGDQGSLGQSELKGKENSERAIFFELETPLALAESSLVYEYIKGIEELYFKAYVRLKKNLLTGEIAYDYVEGYTQIETGSTTYGLDPTSISGGKYHRGFLTVKEDPASGAIRHFHPIRRAAWDYMRLQRKDLLYPSDASSNGIKQFLGIILSGLRDLKQLVTGYYNHCYTSGYAKELLVNPSADDFKPSFVRLNTTDKSKYGGGHRVKRLTIKDNWDDMASGTEAEYGQEYQYKMADGSSSGVAEYEPIIGGEENPWRQPLRYSQKISSFKSLDMYVEEPLGESYFPGAGVGYRRVVVRNIRQEDPSHAKITKAAQGILVNEFYTAKDFPVMPDYTTLDDNAKYKMKILIPLVGSRNYDNLGFSQGFRIELNDMHGKAKSVATYPYGADINDPSVKPVSSTTYVYATKAPYNPDSRNQLSSEAQVIDGLGMSRKGIVGRQMDFFIDVNENACYTDVWGGDINTEVVIFGILPIPIPIPQPAIEYSEAMFRSIVSNKIINRSGILKKTINYKDGSFATTENRVFDSETGRPLITTVTNDFDSLVYNYNIPAHWAYNGMGGAYKNVGSTLTAMTCSSGYVSMSNPKQYFVEGDEVIVDGTTKYWVKQVNNSAGNIYLINEAGAAASNFTNKNIYISRSGYRNLLNTDMGSIVSLSNPVNLTYSSQTSIPDYLNFCTDLPHDIGNFGFGVAIDNPFVPGVNMIEAYPLEGWHEPYCRMNCTDRLTVGHFAFYTGTPNQIGFLRYDYLLSPPAAAACTSYVSFPAGSYITSFADISKYYYFWDMSVGQMKAVEKYDYTATPIPLSGAYETCMWPLCSNVPDILQASATQFSDEWTFNYDDVGAPPSDINTTKATNNPYRYGARGIWRPLKTYTYLENRMQESAYGYGVSTTDTKLQKDGIFETFSLFNWPFPAASSSKWQWIAEITRYNPYGFEIENKDPLGRYSAALYGYKNSAATAVAQNASYFEIGFDGFEEYTASSYPACTTSTCSLKAPHFTLQNSDISYSTTTAAVACTTEAHTGKNSMNMEASKILMFKLPTSAVVSGATSPSTFTGLTVMLGKKYVVSAWIKPTDNTKTPQISIVSSGASITQSSTLGPLIDGWRKVETTFSVASISSNPLKIELSIPSGGGSTIQGYADDIRIQPFESAVKTYVYDTKTLWLVAELDNQNYATFYNYDEQGSLVQVKKETVKGIQTLRTTRNNSKQILP